MHAALSGNQLLLALVVAVVIFAAGLLLTRWKIRFQAINQEAREKLAAAVPDGIEFVTVDVADVPNLNRSELETLTGKLAALGFVPLLDYRIRMSTKSGLQGFARLFQHPQEKCYAEIQASAQALAKGEKFLVAINSYMDDGWSLGTSNTPTIKAHYFMQLSRVLRMRYPDDPVEQLFARHLERRKQILQDLAISVSPDLSAERYFARARESNSQRREAMKKTNPIGGMIVAEVHVARRTEEWLGDYPAEAKRRRAQRAATSPAPN